LIVPQINQLGAAIAADVADPAGINRRSGNGASGHLPTSGNVRRMSALAGTPIADIDRRDGHVRKVRQPPPDIPERHNLDVPDSRPNFYCSDYRSDRGRYQANPHGPNQTIVQ
jgi:hypothetical protein